jgi:predicted Zn-dependent protease with MMP-like domain
VNRPNDSENAAEDFADAIDERLYDDPDAALAMAEGAPGAIAKHPAVRLMHALATAEMRGVKLALPLLEQVVLDHPEHADARHALGKLYEAVDDLKAAKEQYLEVLRLDAADDVKLGFDFNDASEPILQTAKHTVEGLPKEFRDRVARVPIVIESRPAEDLVELGFDPRSLGLFEGPDHALPMWETRMDVPRIVLYAANLMASLPPNDWEALDREVEITVLHEIAHYFGLDEEQVEALGLE